MEITERIFQFIEHKGISTNEFSKRVGVSNGYFAKQRTSKANIGSKIIEKIVSAYPDVNLWWLILGRGVMILEEKETPIDVQIQKPQVHLYKPQSPK